MKMVKVFLLWIMVIIGAAVVCGLLPTLWSAPANDEVEILVLKPINTWSIHVRIVVPGVSEGIKRGELCFASGSYHYGSVILARRVHYPFFEGDVELVSGRKYDFCLWDRNRSLGTTKLAVKKSPLIIHLFPPPR